MNIPAHRLYPIVALTLLAGATLWLARISAPEEERVPLIERGKPDFVAVNSRLLSFDASGRQRYELLADRITRYPGTDVTVFDNPRLHQESNGRRLQLTADTAEAFREGEELLLRGNVRGRRSGLAGEPDATFVSETLRVWPNDERARSRSPVVLTRGNTVIHANGLKADSIFGTLLLDGRVNATMPRRGRNTP
ncbi:LPS export ABC transporter periplasmic protein LptC [Thauera sp. CAU 1555]|jgi:lipopolysaccharide export system protein LptC|uniref:LPS export ABC transporter periplasmic protein LptC n=1 Tax=Thauera sedimentorum TaxID=2767595 RepID=A0ABR9BE24_9RHOO|nr:LPS export ABC transporter periplasmic protein LptC [Thauera sedimentorum]MBC9073558.1 LPS export ABC transporter periplasmic protein LptC [Thauera sedimentorum]MBD8504477.1 LPS export ABC transporter periplasmic protein LptC [Thauera sedimentorum]